MMLVSAFSFLRNTQTRTRIYSSTRSATSTNRNTMWERRRLPRIAVHSFTAVPTSTRTVVPSYRPCRSSPSVIVSSFSSSRRRQTLFGRHISNDSSNGHTIVSTRTAAAATTTLESNGNNNSTAVAVAAVVSSTTNTNTTTTVAGEAATATAATSTTKLETIKELRAQRAERKKKRKISAAKNRQQFIGLAKAVDRGQYQITYQPGGVSGDTGDNGTNFVAVSGLPPQCQTAHTTTTTTTTPPAPAASYFTVLGIESSCDDTGAAIVRSDGTILGEALASQKTIHEAYGGIVPGLAKQAHEENIDGVIADALQQAITATASTSSTTKTNSSRSIQGLEDIDAIGVTVGPGLELCLRVGTEKAKQLAIQYNKPFVGIHHLEAHILMARLNNNNNNSNNKTNTDTEPGQQEQEPKLEFPFLALLVSGGHCQLLKCLGIGRYEVLGGTLDDSLGECYDKTARLLGLPVGGGGGPAVERLAQDGNPTSIPLTIPLQKRKDSCDFSYAGLKTNIRRAAEQLVQERNNNKRDDAETSHNITSVSDLSYKDKANLAASFQNIAIVHLEMRLKNAIKLLEKQYQQQKQQQQELLTTTGEENTTTIAATAATKITTLTVVGGVAANQEVRRRLQMLCDANNYTMIVPPPRLCTDQGAMSAWAAIERLNVGSSDNPHTQDIFARYPFASTSSSTTNPKPTITTAEPISTTQES